MSRTPQQIANKVQWEGGIGDAIYYFGRELDSTDSKLNKLWKAAYDAMERVMHELPPEENEDE